MYSHKRDYESPSFTAFSGGAELLPLPRAARLRGRGARGPEGLLHLPRAARGLPPVPALLPLPGMVTESGRAHS